LTAMSATAAGVWIAPSIVGLDQVAAATGSAAAPTLTGDALPGTLSSGDSLRPGANPWSANNRFYVFQECSLTLTAGQTTQSGMTLPTGVEITSYLVHYSRNGGTGTVDGTVSFPGTIVGYDWSDAALVGSDADWAVPGVNYGTTLRRMEWPGNDDLTFTLPNFLDIEMYAGAGFVDQIRVYVVV